MKRVFTRLFFAGLLLGIFALPNKVYCQPDHCPKDDPMLWGPCCDMDGNYDPTLPTCPIDGGLVALLTAGVGYGIMRVRRAGKEEIVEE